MEKTIRRGGEKVAGSTSPLTKGKEEEREVPDVRIRSSELFHRNTRSMFDTVKSI